MADSLVKGLRAAVGFMTGIPVRIREGDYECFLSRIYLFVPVGLLIGLLIGTISLALLWLLPVVPAAALIIVCLYMLTGINHADGLSDMADGLAVSGPREKKINAMKDVHTGTGGVMAIGLDLLFLFALIVTAGYAGAILAYMLVVAEVCAKVSMTSVIAFGQSMGPGMGAMAIAAAKKSHFIAGFVLAATVITIVTVATMLFFSSPDGWKFGVASIAAMLSPLVVGALLMWTANRNFGGVNGDVMGAANEIGRIAALAVMVVVLWMHW